MQRVLAGTAHRQAPRGRWASRQGGCSLKGGLDCGEDGGVVGHSGGLGIHGAGLAASGRHTGASRAAATRQAGQVSMRVWHSEQSQELQQQARKDTWLACQRQMQAPAGQPTAGAHVLASCTALPAVQMMGMSSSLAAGRWAGRQPEQHRGRPHEEANIAAQARGTQGRSKRWARSRLAPPSGCRAGDRAPALPTTWTPSGSCTHCASPGRGRG